MIVRTMLAGVAIAGVMAIAPVGANAAVYSAGGGTSALAAVAGAQDHAAPQLVQHRGRQEYRRGGSGPGWGYRPYSRRPYYGTIVGGIALGALLGVTVYGLAPPVRPSPDLCWYWADPVQSRGYWDYC